MQQLCVSLVQKNAEIVLKNPKNRNVKFERHSAAVAPLPGGAQKIEHDAVPRPTVKIYNATKSDQSATASSLRPIRQKIFTCDFAQRKNSHVTARYVTLREGETSTRLI